MQRALIIWVLGLLTIVPGGLWYLFFHAPRSQYALLIVGILFWIFGYWSVVGPVLMLQKARGVMRRLQQASSHDDLVTALRSAEARDVAIDLLATENRLPRFLAERLYDRVMRMIEAKMASGRSVESG